jgi:hypothetical protein
MLKEGDGGLGVTGGRGCEREGGGGPVLGLVRIIAAGPTAINLRIEHILVQGGEPRQQRLSDFWF